jgi:F420-non-reducing hydrogenase small subunit
MNNDTPARPKLALYWASSCGGCEIAVLDIEEKILDVAAAWELVFWPVALDFKVQDVEALPDGGIDLCLFNGAVRNSDNHEMALLLRRKSKLLVAFGSCAAEGCIPALANAVPPEAIFEQVYLDSPSTDNPRRTLPQATTPTPHGDLHLPEFWSTVRSLDQVVPVDYTVPGCPPQAHQIGAVLDAVTAAVLSGAPLPAAGSVLGAGEKSCCDECSRVRHERKLKKLYRIWELFPDPELCLLDQGLLCMGPATRSGCGARCTAVGVPCRGCYGAPPDSRDQGAKMVSALASVIDSHDPEELERILADVVDPIGTFYRFSLAKATLGRARTAAAARPAANP